MVDLVTIPGQRGHAVVTGTEACSDRPGQVHWLQACPCGWERSGKYLESHEQACQRHLLQLANEHVGSST